jgi:hypothetical protein
LGADIATSLARLQGVTKLRARFCVMGIREADRVRKIALTVVPGCSASQGDFAPSTLAMR